MSVVITASGGLATPRPDLADAYREYNPAGVKLAYPEIFPAAQVPLQYGEMEVETVDSYLAEDDLDRNPGGSYNRIDIELSKKQYAIREKGLEIPFNYGDGRVLTYDWEQGAARRLRMKHDLYYEGVASGIVFASTATTTSATAAWTASGGKPLTDLQTGIEAFYARTGMLPNALIMGRKAAAALPLNAEVTGRFPGATMFGQQAVLESIATLVGIDKVIIGTAVKNSGTKGNAKSLGAVFPVTHVALALVANEGDPVETACLGRALVWSEDGANDVIIENYYVEATRTEVYRGRNQKLINTWDTTLVQRVATGLT